MILFDDEISTKEIRSAWYKVVNNEGLTAILYLSDQDVKQYRSLGYAVDETQGLKLVSREN